VAAGWALAAVATFVILKAISLFTSLRVPEEDEVYGLDLALHGEVAYNFLSSGMSTISHVPISRASELAAHTKVVNEI